MSRLLLPLLMAPKMLSIRRIFWLQLVRRLHRFLESRFGVFMFLCRAFLNHVQIAYVFRQDYSKHDHANQHFDFLIGYESFVFFNAYSWVNSLIVRILIGNVFRSQFFTRLEYPVTGCVFLYIWHLLYRAEIMRMLLVLSEKFKVFVSWVIEHSSTSPPSSFTFAPPT